MTANAESAKKSLNYVNCRQQVDHEYLKIHYEFDELLINHHKSAVYFEIKKRFIDRKKAQAFERKTMRDLL